LDQTRFNLTTLQLVQMLTRKNVGKNVGTYGGDTYAAIRPVVEMRRYIGLLPALVNVYYNYGFRRLWQRKAHGTDGRKDGRAERI